MSRSKLLSKFAILVFLVFPYCAVYSMEKPEVLSAEKSLTDLLPAELWSMIAEYLPGNNKFLNTDLARQVVLSKTTQERIIENFIASIDAKSSDLDLQIKNFITSRTYIITDIKESYLKILKAFGEENFEQFEKCLFVKDEVSKDINPDILLSCLATKANMIKDRIAFQKNCAVFAFCSIPLFGFLFQIDVVKSSFIPLYIYIVGLLNFDQERMGDLTSSEILFLEISMGVSIALYIQAIKFIMPRLESKEASLKRIWG